jgi:cytochrome bd-type quinol oxidase subunit 2
MRRWAAWCAWALWVLVLAALVVTMVFGAAESVDHSTQVPVLITFAFFVLAFATVGALVASRQPGNPIGWIMCASAIAYAIGGLSAAFAQTPEGPTVLQQWLGSWIWGLGIAGAGTFLLLLFPDGSLPSRRWRPLAWVAALGTAAFVLGQAFGPELADTNVRNPVGFDGAAGRAFESLREGVTLVIGATLASVVSLVVRFRRANDEERHQLKWLTYAAGVVALAVVGAALIDTFAAPSDARENVQITLLTGALACVPIAIGIAVFKYRLYDIDVIISRTLVYVPLLGIIGGLATAMVPFSQRVFVALTGNESDAAVVLTALFVASLITPVRKRLEAGVERRFRPTADPRRGTENGSAADLLADPDVDARMRAIAEDAASGVEARIRSIAERAAREAVARDRKRG